MKLTNDCANEKKKGKFFLLPSNITRCLTRGFEVTLLKWKLNITLFDMPIFWLKVTILELQIIIVYIAAVNRVKIFIYIYIYIYIYILVWKHTKNHTCEQNQLSALQRKPEIKSNSLWITPSPLKIFHW